MASLTDLTARLLDAAKAAGAEAADAMAVMGMQASVEVRQGQLEEAQRAEGVEVGLRVMLGRRQAVVSSSDTRDATLSAMAERAVAMAREAPEDPTTGLADPSQLAQDRDAGRLELCDPAAEPEPAALEAQAREAEAAALAVPGVTQTESAGASWSRREVALAASNGFSGGYMRSDRSISCGAISGTGTRMEREWDWDHRVFASDLRSPEEIGRTAGERAAAREGSRKPRTGTFPILFDERVASSLIGHLLSAINGAAIARGSSFLRDAMGQMVLPEGLSLAEDPHRPRSPASRLWDGEGLPTHRRAIVEDGRLTTWTLDLASARKLGLESTGNAARGPGGTPSPSVTNVELTQGTASREDLLAGMGTGLLVTGLIGSTINPNTGDYSRGASGFWVEGGQVAHPVNECTIAGNLRDMLKRIVPANDARPWLTRVVPSLLVEGMTLAGD
ncbi:TldE/PmbA protein, part of proposed TldE/TldD proteolytic complex [Rubellimicrobium mesophilum DSM 19309]|uniref:TldE/PmbA protein, part of proposed TldE/TldD proteolytic complex n=1 Tax=Rubellimicrobium mesophilum DSM 19309 TaxID=442562 RepID=A0A017HJZ8_9RHOB|nr:TldD/PmbA family protein [Rubellimicrobium mesophilum]EYD74681.1 TldE/PmbA protein, part of proposed TldE/TldD proteolytic complex [Rubellimicrobium mesophilum DSM 19309]